MNLTELLRQAAGGQGFEALARQHGVTTEQAQNVAGALLPAMSSGLKRMSASPDGLTQVAGMLRSNDAATVADAPEANAETANAQGAAFLEQIFGGSRGDIEQAVSSDAASRAGVDGSTAASMLPMIASMVLGMMQQRETSDSGLGGLVGSILGGQQAGASQSDASGGLGGVLGGLLGGSGAQASGGMPDLGALTAMFDADGDGSVADDLLDRFMKR